MGTKGQAWSPEMVCNVRVLHSFGYAAGVIARLTGLSRKQVTDWLYRLHYEKPRRPRRVAPPPNASIDVLEVEILSEQHDQDDGSAEYDGPTTADRLQALHVRMDALVADRPPRIKEQRRPLLAQGGGKPGGWS